MYFFTSSQIPVSECTYIVDVDYPSAKVTPPEEPRYATSPEWEREHCVPFLDAARSSRLARIFWIPDQVGELLGLGEGGGKIWGDYCLLKRREKPPRV
jgi:alpha-1,2-mannosyltransferase